MAQVDLFPDIDQIFDDTAFPLQRLGNGQSPAARNAPWSVIMSTIIAGLGLSDSVSVSTSTYTYNLLAGRWLLAVAVQSASGQSFDLGLSSGTDELISAGEVTGGGAASTFGVLLYGGTGGLSIHFSGLTGTSTITFLSV